MIQKQFIKVSTNSLIPYENNPRINDPAVADVMESIRQCENLDPIEVDEDYVILSGHTRLLALQGLGITETEVVQYTGLTDEQKRKYRILANKTNELAQWDFEKLEQELADLDFGEFSFTFSAEDEIDESDLDDESEKNSVVVTLRFESADDYTLYEERIKNLADEANATVSVKME